MTQTRTEELKNRVATQGGKKQPSTLKEWVSAYEGQVAKVLPKHMDPKRMIRIVQTVLSQNPKLMECHQGSFLGALMTAASLGLEPGLMGQCYILPFYSGKDGGFKAEFQIGYKGLIDLSRRSGDLAQITVQAIHVNDEFEWEFGSNAHLMHRPKIDGDRGEIRAFYCYTKLKNGEESFTVMSLSEIEAHRDKFTKSRRKDKSIFGPWVDDFNAMAKKTVVKQHFKYMPLSVELQENLSKDETIRFKPDEEEPPTPTYDIEVEPIEEEEEKAS